MPSRRHVRAIRQAISPRLAMRTDRITLDPRRHPIRVWVDRVPAAGTVRPSVLRWGEVVSSMSSSHPEHAEAVVDAFDDVVVDGGQAHPEDRARVAWVDDPVVVDPAGHEQGQRLALDL